MIRTSCEIVEYNHKGSAKTPYQSSNRKNYFPQFVDHNARHAAIELAEEYFEYRDVYDEMTHQDSGVIDSLALARAAGRLDHATRPHAKRPNRIGNILAIMGSDADFADLPSALVRYFEKNHNWGL